MAKKNKQKKDRFFSFTVGSVIFYILIVLFVLAVIFGMKFVNKEVLSYLEDYESSLPKYTVEQIFNDNFKNPDFDSLFEKWGTESDSEFVSKADIISNLKEKTKDAEITYVYVAGSEKTKINVKANGEKFASYTIVKSDEVSKHGFDTYTLGEIKLFYKSDSHFTATIPSIYKIKLNGIELDEKYIKQSEITDDNREKIPEGTYKFYYTKYYVDGLLPGYKLQIFDNHGTEKQFSLDENNCISLVYEYSEELKSQYEKYVLDATKLYSCRMQNDATFADCRGYFEPGTTLYKNIQSNPSSFVWEHDGYSFEDEETLEYYSYDENTFRCRVKLNHILHKKGLKDHPDYLDLTLYLRKDDKGTFKIYAMENN